MTDGLSADDFDDPSGDLPAPLPPHERTWMHPSELGAITAAERARAGDAVKRAGALVAVACAALAFVFVHAVNSSRRPAQRVSALVTEPARTTGGRTAVPIVVVGIVDGTNQPVVAIGNEPVLVVPAGQGPPGSTVSVSFHDAPFLATVLDVPVEPGLQLLRIVPAEEDVGAAGAPAPPIATPAPEPARGDEIAVHGADAAIGTARVGIASGALRPLVPVDPGDDHPAGGGPAFNAEGHLLGWVVERNGSHVLVPVAELLAALPRLAADGQQS